MRFSQYGKRELAIFLVIPIVLFTLLSVYFENWPLLLGALPFVWFVCNFFRDPERDIPSEEGTLVSPADGEVTAIEETQMPWIGKCHRISVFMNVFSVHVNRMPVKGQVEYVEKIPGKFLNAMNGEAATANERVLVGLKGEDGKKYLIAQIAGLIARNIVTPVKEGDTFEKGERFGMIKFGSRADIYVEVDQKFEARVTVGQKVSAGSDILASVK